MLHKLLGFDRWHVTTLRKRGYARDIIHYANGRKIRGRAAEIGCGLGDIIRHLQYRVRLGLDSDPRVLRGAAFLASPFSRKIRWSVFHFPDTPLQGTFDLIIMVNWIHHIEPETLKRQLEVYFSNSLNRGGEIILDTVQDPSYEYNHDIAFLMSGLGVVPHEIGAYERRRQVWSLKKTT